MITFVEGILAEALPTQIVINVGGIGYQIYIPLSSFDRLPLLGERIKVLTHLVVREDAHLLYGFVTGAERDLFRLLIQFVTGVGPKLALSILSGMSVEMFKSAVVQSDVAAIARIKGVGKKTAERIVVELKDKVGIAAEWEAASAQHAPSALDIAVQDAVLALISLGYKQAEAHRVLSALRHNVGDEVSSEELVRRALKQLAAT